MVNQALAEGERSEDRRKNNINPLSGEENKLQTEEGAKNSVVSHRDDKTDDKIHIIRYHCCFISNKSIIQSWYFG